jgi:hypothetical protein
MKDISSKSLRIALDERWPRIVWYGSPDGKTRIPGEREAVAPRVYIFRKGDRAQLTSDDDSVMVDYDLRASDREAVYRATVTCDGALAVEFDLTYGVKDADAFIRLDNVREHPGYYLLTVRFQRVVAASSRDEDGRVVTCLSQGRVLDPAKCQPNMIDYNWHGSTARPCGAAYRGRFMVTIDIPGWENLFINEVRQYTRIAWRETIASIGTELMYRRRTVEDPTLQLQVPPGKSVPVEVPDEPILSAEPRVIRLHAIAARKGRALDWTDAAKYFQSLIDPKLKPRAVYDHAIVGKCCFAQFREPLLTLEQGLDLVRRIYHLTDGMKHVCYFTAFQHEGGDSGRPDVLTVYPPVGDVRTMRRIIREAKRYNAIISFHDNQSQADVAWKDFDWDMAARDSLGRPFGGGVWGQVQLVQTSMPACLEMLKKKISEIIRTYGIRKTYHLDTIGMQWTCDTHPRRRHNATQCHAADFELLREYNRHGIDVTGEILVDPYVGKLGHVWALFNYGTTWQGEERVPFANYIYHGATSWNAGHAELPLTYFADKYNCEDTLLGMLLEGGGVGLTLRGGQGGEWMPGMPEQGHDRDMMEMADLLYLVQPPYYLLRNRKWTGYRQEGSVRRAEYGRGSYVEVDPAKPGYKVLVDGNLVAKDFTTVFAGPRKGTLLAYSRTNCDLDWPAPAGWKSGALPAVALTESGSGVTVPARIERGRLRLKLLAHQPVRIEPR